MDYFFGYSEINCYTEKSFLDEHHTQICVAQIYVLQMWHTRTVYHYHILFILGINKASL